MKSVYIHRHDKSMLKDYLARSMEAPFGLISVICENDRFI